jgi:hypothetical protein
MAQVLKFNVMLQNIWRWKYCTKQVAQALGIAQRKVAKATWGSTSIGRLDIVLRSLWRVLTINNSLIPLTCPKYVNLKVWPWTSLAEDCATLFYWLSFHAFFVLLYLLRYMPLGRRASLQSLWVFRLCFLVYQVWNFWFCLSQGWYNATMECHYFMHCTRPIN